MKNLCAKPVNLIILPRVTISKKNEMTISPTEKRSIFCFFPVLKKSPPQDYGSKYYKPSETQMLKCYSKKPDSKSSTQDSFSLPPAEKPEKGKEEKELAGLEEKLSNVSTSFSSKEKPWEEDITTPKLQSCSRKSDPTVAKAPLVTISLATQLETISIEIFKVGF